MGRLDLDIIFKQTTSKAIRCRMCGDNIDGEDGYIKINLFSWDGVYYSQNVEKRINICNGCFKKWMDKITTATEKKKKSYNKLVKTKILKSLK